MDFPGYPKIAEALSRYRLDEAAARALSRVDWVATEKIHGANMCFVTDGERVRCAKRKAWLEPDERFFDHHRARERVEPGLMALFEALRRDDPAIQEVYVYGELFGGAYPHPEVEPVPGLQPIQTGVYYHPDVRFAAFDLACDRGEEGWTFADFEVALERFREAGIFAVEPLARGRLEAMQALELGFDSTLPARLGLPALPPGGNPAEGIVIKPARGIILPDGRVLRPVLKRKIASFAEDARFHRAERWQARPAEDTGYHLDLLEWEAMARLNANRVDAALSKEGRPESGETQAIQGLARVVVEDIFEELAHDHGDALCGLSAEERALLEAALRDDAEEAVRARLRATDLDSEGEAI